MCGEVFRTSAEGSAVCPVRAGAVPDQPGQVCADVPGWHQGQGDHYPESLSGSCQVMFLVRLGWTQQRLTWANTGRSLRRVPLRAVTRTFRSCQIYWSKLKMHWRVNEPLYMMGEEVNIATHWKPELVTQINSCSPIKSDNDTIWIICIFRLLNHFFS